MFINVINQYSYFYYGDNEMNDNSLKEQINELKQQNEELLHEINLLQKISLKGNENIAETENYCPICEDFYIFEDFGEKPRYNVQCPKCHSKERHRLIYFLFKQRYGQLFSKNINLLHFGPEKIFYKYFTNKNNINYFPVDFVPEIYEKRNIHIRDKVNMEEIPYPDNTFDFIYNCHILEHVPNDIKAMNELYRVLKDDGVCITLVPLFDIENTLEKEEYNTPELRLKYYGQHDHLRKYGLDFKNRLESSGFNVEEIHTSDLVKSKFKRELYKLANDVIYVCTK